jgi:hypothetical protein
MQPGDEEFENFPDNFVVGRDDGGGMHKADSSTTIIRDVLTGLSSKHHELSVSE